MQPLTEKKHIQSDPTICSGRPCVVGTRVRVQDIYVCHEIQGRSPDEILVAYPSLSLGDIYAAIAYYHDHRDEIQRQMQDEGTLIEAMKAKLGPGPLQTILGTDADASLPSR